MSEQQRVIAAPAGPGLVEKYSRQLALKALSYLKQGYLILTEQGSIVGEFGDKTSALQARIEVVNNRTYRRFLFEGDIGAGESYVDGDWNTPDLLAVIRLFAVNLEAMDKIASRFSWLSWPLQKLAFFAKRNSRTNARQNILQHYDLGNNLYTRFLDSRMQYSSAVYPQPEATLEQAQQHKLARLCRMLDLQPGDHLLEIGTGWGGLAIYAAQHYGCRVTTTTISKAQYQYACEQVAEYGLQQQITLLTDDYRDLQGQYDKLVSVEMIEAVGKRWLPAFFRRCDALLKPNGRMVLQAITIADQRVSRYDRDVDFIQQVVFPGGYLPSVGMINRLLGTETSMVLRQLDDIGLDYARTLADWRQRFNQRRHELETFGYDERFNRFWNYYLSYCEGGFAERCVSAVQLLATKPAAKEALRTTLR